MLHVSVWKKDAGRFGLSDKNRSTPAICCWECEMPSPYRQNYAQKFLVEFTCVFLFMIIISTSEIIARQGEPPTSWAGPVSSLSLVSVMRLPAITIGEELQKAANEAGPGPLKVAVPNEVSISPDRDGRWEGLPRGGQLWRYRFHAPGATDLSFGFTTFRLPPGASLHIFSETERYHEGPYTGRDNKSHGELWTPMVPGDRAVVELFVPDHPDFSPELELSQVSAGFSDFLGQSRRRGLVPKQAGCNIDVICPEGNPWRDEIRSVAQY